MAIRFNKVAVQLACEGADQNQPVVARLTARGDLVFQNWNREADLAAVELGFKTDNLPCLALEENYYLLFDDEQHVTELTLHRSYQPLYAEALRVRAKLRLRGKEAIAHASYRGPVHWSVPLKPISGERLQRIRFDGLNPTGAERISGGVRTVFVEGSSKAVSVLCVYLYTTVQAYMDVLRFIPSGLVVEKSNKPVKGNGRLVAAIDEVLGKDRLLVVAGRQLADMSIRSERAIVILSGVLNREWVIERWL